jgi:hypothetical protein
MVANFLEGCISSISKLVEEESSTFPPPQIGLYGRAIAEAVLPTAGGPVRSNVRSFGIYGGQRDTPSTSVTLPTLLPSTSPYSLLILLLTLQSQY